MAAGAIFIDFFCLYVFLSSNPEAEKVIFCKGTVLHRRQCVRGFGDWIDSILEFSQALHRMKLDVSSFSCLAALVIIAGESSGRAFPCFSTTLPRDKEVSEFSSVFCCVLLWVWMMWQLSDTRRSRWACD